MLTADIIKVLALSLALLFVAMATTQVARRQAEREKGVSATARGDR